MNTNEINSLVYQLNQNTYLLEEEYTENEGEVTESTEAKEKVIASMKELLLGEGIDSLGRWLKSKEDQLKTLKAEKEAITHKMNKVNETIDFIKANVNSILTATGVDKAKGTLYSFAPSISTKTSVEKEILKDLFAQKIEEVLRGGEKPIIPADVTITLGASVSALPEGAELPEYYTQVSTPSCKFIKPRSSKTKEE